jgi:hypothetical protein
MGRKYYTNIEEVAFRGVDWIRLAQDREGFTLVNTIINLSVP